MLISCQLMTINDNDDDDHDEDDDDAQSWKQVLVDQG